MRCLQCDYPLLNLVDRTCPECGLEFRPSEYCFPPKKIRFCCPQCHTAYYGTDERGHLEPKSFDCVECGRRLHMDEMVLRPAEGVSERELQVNSVAWPERQRRGRVRAFFSTIWQGMTVPGEVIRFLPKNASLGDAVGFMAIMVALALALPWLVIVIIMMFDVSYLDAEDIGYGLLAFAGVSAMGIGVLAVWMLSAHLVLRMIGGAKQGVGRTMLAFSYTSGANAMNFLVGLGVVWWALSFAVALGAAHRTSVVRTFVAVFALPVLAIMLWIGIAIADATSGNNDRYYSGGYAMPPAAVSGPAQPMPPEHLEMYAEYLRKWGSEHDGDGPPHILPLCLDYCDAEHDDEQYFTSEWGAGKAFCASASSSTMSSAPVGEGTLEEAMEADAIARLSILAEFLEAWPEDVIAYRFGDYIFTYPGVDLTEYSTGIWIVVELRDPAANGEPDASTVVWARKCCDEVMFTWDAMAGKLAEQNALRAKHGLPPLPDLLTITHEQPAFASEDEGDGGSDARSDGIGEVGGDAGEASGGGGVSGSE
jgi:uncharacterized membrane protein YgcG